MNNGKLTMSNSHELITDYGDYRARLTKFGEHRVCEVFAGGLLMKIHSTPDGSRIVRNPAGKSVRNRLAAGGNWIRTSGSGASGEADAILPVKDRPR
jgi:hypothetical protein